MVVALTSWSQRAGWRLALANISTCEISRFWFAAANSEWHLSIVCELHPVISRYSPRATLVCEWLVVHFQILIQNCNTLLIDIRFDRLEIPDEESRLRRQK